MLGREARSTFDGGVSYLESHVAASGIRMEMKLGERAGSQKWSWMGVIAVETQLDVPVAEGLVDLYFKQVISSIPLFELR